MHCSKKIVIRSPRRRAVEAASGTVEAERLGGLEIDHQLELDRGLHGKLARLLALEDAVDIGRRAPKIIDQVNSVGQQAAELQRRNGTDRRQGDDSEPPAM